MTRSQRGRNLERSMVVVMQRTTTLFESKRAMVFPMLKIDNGSTLERCYSNRSWLDELLKKPIVHDPSKTVPTVLHLDRRASCGKAPVSHLGRRQPPRKGRCFARFESKRRTRHTHTHCGKRVGLVGCTSFADLVIDRARDVNENRSFRSRQGVHRARAICTSRAIPTL